MIRMKRVLTALPRCSSLIYLEGEAAMRKFQNAENKEQHALSIVQRMLPAPFHSPICTPFLPPALLLSWQQLGRSSLIISQDKSTFSRNGLLAPKGRARARARARARLLVNSALFVGQGVHKRKRWMDMYASGLP